MVHRLQLGPRTLRWWCGLVVACLASTAVVAGVTPPARADAQDSVTVSGYELLDLRPTPVPARSEDNNLLFRYVAGASLRDGSLSIDVPRADWSDPLWVNDYIILGLRSDDGSVVVRPTNGPEYDPVRDCSVAAVRWSVQQLPRVQRIVVDHLDCEPGQQVSVRIWGIAAPQRPGGYRFPIAVVDSGGARRVAAARLRVRPEPRVRLSISVPDQVPWATPVTVVVKALLPNGRIARSYRGGVTLNRDVGTECSVNLPREPSRIHEFTAADAGVYSFTVFLYESGRLVARDVGREARPSSGDPFVITGMPDGEGLVCVDPISFH